MKNEKLLGKAKREVENRKLELGVPSKLSP